MAKVAGMNSSCVFIKYIEYKDTIANRDIAIPKTLFCLSDINKYNGARYVTKLVNIAANLPKGVVAVEPTSSIINCRLS